MRQLRFLLAAIVATLAVTGLSGCPGGATLGGTAGTGGSGGSGGTGGTGGSTATAANVVIVGNSQLPSNASGVSPDPGGITLTAIVTDANGGAISGVTVTFTSVCTITTTGCGTSNDRGVLSPSSSTTNASGQASTVLTTGGDTALRTITVTATAGSESGTKVVTVVNPSSSGGGTPVVASVDLLASSPQLQSSADTTAEGVTLTAIVKDANGVLLSGVDVSFAITSGTGALQITSATTNASGTATAVLHTGGNPTNRNITVTATASGPVTDTFTIPVVGTTLTISGPTSLGIGSGGAYTVTLKDSSGAGIPSQTVTIVSQSSKVTPSSIGVVTNASGQATTTLTGASSGTDTIHAQFAGITPDATLDITVSGVNFAFVTPTPLANSSVPFNTNQAIRVQLTDSGAVAGQQVQLTSTRGTISGGDVSASVDTTDASGFADFTINASTVGVATLSASVITAGAYQNVNVQRQIEFVATNPANVTVQAQPATIPINSQSTITAVVRDANNNPVKGITVNFTITGGTGAGSLSAPTAVTDSVGSASVFFLSNSSSSGLSNVIIQAQELTNNNTGTTSLTVGGQALRITLGTGNEISAPSTTTYKLPYVAIVTDSAGNPPPSGTTFRLELESLSYQKGFYEGTGSARVIVYRATPTGGDNFGCANEDVNRNGIRDVTEDANGNGILDPGEDVNGDNEISSNVTDADEDVDNDHHLDVVETDTDSDGKPDQFDEDIDGDSVLDPGEDLDGDGNLDVQEDKDRDGKFDTVDEDNTGVGDGDGILDYGLGEDANGDGVLWPGNPAAVPSTAPVSSDGISHFFDITYPQDRALWVKVKLRAIATVAGTESVEEATFVLPILASDLTGQGDPPGNPSPYGFAAHCFDNN